MMRRGTTLSIAVAAVITGAFALGAGCGGPYKGKPDKLPKVKKTKEPQDAAAAGPAAPTIAWIDECDSKQAEDPAKAKNSRSKAAPFLDAGDSAYDSGRGTDVENDKARFYLKAVDEYRKALVEDNYNAAATYALAKVYARLWRKGCAIKMLERLAKLQVNPRFVLGGQTTIEGLIDAVESEDAFAGFRNDAKKAVGR